jgi:hypothetical protein
MYNKLRSILHGILVGLVLAALFFSIIYFISKSIPTDHFVLRSSSSGEVAHSEVKFERARFNGTCIPFLGKCHNVSSWLNVQSAVDCLTNHGSWDKDPKLEYQHLCYQHASKSCSGANRVVGLKYKWEVKKSACSQPIDPLSFSLKNMCQLMQERTIMIVGDSMNGQFSTSLINQLTLETPETCDPDVGIFASGMQEIKCYHLGYANFRLLIVRNDRLSLVKQYTITPGVEKFADFVEYSWTGLMNVTDPALVLFNRGAHYENSSKLIHDIDRAISYVIHNHPRVPIIWRNTPRGVENSSLTFEDAPLATPLDPDRPSALPFAYEHFHQQNLAVRSHLARYYPTVIYWDIAHPMSYREDGHRDPLHYCFPGPIDSWPWFFYNILKLMNNAS